MEPKERKLVAVAVRLDATTAAVLEELAERECEGNRSQAVRRLLREANKTSDAGTSKQMEVQP